MHQKGFTLMEQVVVIGIIAIIGVGAGTFAYTGLRLLDVTRDHIAAQENARATFKQIIGEIREMQISDNGSSALAAAEDNNLVFYSNVDADSDRERVRYTLTGGTLFKGVTQSDSQEPPQYPYQTDEVVTTVAENIINTAPLFSYYDDSYDGTTAPLADPVDRSLVRLIKIEVLIDYDPGRTPAPLELETNIVLRNLKDNL